LSEDELDPLLPVNTTALAAALDHEIFFGLICNTLAEDVQRVETALTRPRHSLSDNKLARDAVVGNLLKLDRIIELRIKEFVQYWAERVAFGVAVYNTESRELVEVLLKHRPELLHVFFLDQVPDSFVLPEEADVNARDLTMGGQTVLMKLLFRLSKCSDQPCRTTLEKTIEMLIHHPKIDLDVVDHSGYTVLMQAVAHGSTKIVELLLQLGARTNVVTSRGTALTESMRWCCLGDGPIRKMPANRRRERRQIFFAILWASDKIAEPTAGAIGVNLRSRWCLQSQRSFLSERDLIAAQFLLRDKVPCRGGDDWSVEPTLVGMAVVLLVEAGLSHYFSIGDYFRGMQRLKRTVGSAELQVVPHFVRDAMDVAVKKLTTLVDSGCTVNEAAGSEDAKKLEIYLGVLRDLEGFVTFPDPQGSTAFCKKSRSQAAGALFSISKNHWGWPRSIGRIVLHPFRYQNVPQVHSEST